MATYEFIIKNSTSEQSTKPVAGQQDESKSVKGKKQEEIDGKQTIAQGFVAWKKAKSFINQVASYQISTLELQSGAKEYQQKTQFTYNLVNQGVSIVENIAVGVAVGNVYGAIAGAVLGIAQTGISYLQKANTIQLQQNLESLSLQQMNLRAGAGGSRRG